MPELPEVERARKLVETTCVGYKIAHVDAFEDRIVFTGGITHEDYAKELEGRTITGCSRKGKIFWLELSGDGRLPVMHFGMNGMLMLKGREPDWYMRKPKRPQENKDVWPPPKYVKFLLKLEPQNSSVSKEPQELAYLDSRRLGKLRLVPQPVEDHPPISELGFDPYLALPTIEEFTRLVRARPRSTIKGLIMDQSFSAGVGNWVADEILHLARVHPAIPAGMLTEFQLEAMWTQMKEVVNTAVEANADHSKFPKHWLFTWRWRKGKKDKSRKTKDETGGMRLPDGSPATLKFITVGGRTSAYIEELQKLPDGVVYKEPVGRKRAPSDEVLSSSEGPSAAPEETKVVAKSPRKTLPFDKRAAQKAPKKRQIKEIEDDGSSEMSEMEESKRDDKASKTVEGKPKAFVTVRQHDLPGSRKAKPSDASIRVSDNSIVQQPDVAKERKARALVDKAIAPPLVKPSTKSSKKRKITATSADSSDLSSVSGGY